MQLKTSIHLAITVIICLMHGNSFGQDSKTATAAIVYDLPETVTNMIAKQIAGYPDQKALILFSVEDSARYRISIMEDFSKIESFQLLTETLIKTTNRFVRVNTVLIPMITWEDILFADFGTEYYPESKSEKRKIGKKKISFTTDGPTITFDRLGKIY